MPCRLSSCRAIPVAHSVDEGRCADSRRDQRPAALRCRRCRAARTERSRLTIASRAGRGGGERADSVEGVVGDDPGPDEIPERVDDVLREAAAAGGVDGGEERGARRCRCSTMAAWSPVRSGGVDRRHERAQVIREVQRDAAVAIAERFDAQPHHLARSHEEVEVAGAVALDARRQHLGLEHRHREAARPAAARWRRAARRAPARGRTTPCHTVASRPSASVSTGSTSRRSRASDRWRNVRSTPVSHHSRCTPPGRNSPASTRPAEPIRASTSSATAWPSPKRRAHSSRRERPVRARVAQHADRQPGLAPAAAAARGVPGGSGAPERIAIARGILDGDVARAAGDRHPHDPPRPLERAQNRMDVVQGCERAAISASERSPMRISRSCTASAFFAR